MILVAAGFTPQDCISVQIEAGDYSCMREVNSYTMAADYAISSFESPVVTRRTKPIDKMGVLSLADNH